MLEACIYNVPASTQTTHPSLLFSSDKEVDDVYACVPVCKSMFICLFVLKFAFFVSSYPTLSLLQDADINGAYVRCSDSEPNRVYVCVFLLIFLFVFVIVCLCGCVCVCLIVCLCMCLDADPIV